MNKASKNTTMYEVDLPIYGIQDGEPGWGEPLKASMRELEQRIEQIGTVDAGAAIVEHNSDTAAHADIRAKITEAATAAEAAQTTANTANTTASAAMPKAGGAFTGTVTVPNASPTNPRVVNVVVVDSLPATQVMGVLYLVRE